MWYLEWLSRGFDDTLGEATYYQASEELGVKEMSQVEEAKTKAKELIQEKGVVINNPCLVWKIAL